jgi:predicted DNA binding protein
LQWLTLDIYHPGEFNDLTIKYPRPFLAHWVNGSIHAAEFSCGDSRLLKQIKKEALQLMQGQFRVLGFSPAGPNAQIATFEFPYEKMTAIREIEKFSCLVLYPVIYEKGWEHYTIIAVRERVLPKMFSKLEKESKIQIRSKVKIERSPGGTSNLILPEQIFSKITRRQAQALISAIELGYFKIPKKIKLEDIAQVAGTPRTTLEAHLRKAESRIMNSLAPHVKTYFAGR